MCKKSDQQLIRFVLERAALRRFLSIFFSPSSSFGIFFRSGTGDSIITEFVVPSPPAVVRAEGIRDIVRSGDITGQEGEESQKIDRLLVGREIRCFQVLRLRFRGLPGLADLPVRSMGPNS